MNFIKWKNNDKERERDFKHAKYICYWNIILSNKYIDDFILKKICFGGMSMSNSSLLSCCGILYFNHVEKYLLNKLNDLRYHL